MSKKILNSSKLREYADVEWWNVRPMIDGTQFNVEIRDFYHEPSSLDDCSVFYNCTPSRAGNRSLWTFADENLASISISRLARMLADDFSSERKEPLHSIRVSSQIFTDISMKTTKTSRTSSESLKNSTRVCVYAVSLKYADSAVKSVVKAELLRLCEKSGLCCVTPRHETSFQRLTNAVDYSTRTLLEKSAPCAVCDRDVSTKGNVIYTEDAKNGNPNVTINHPSLRDVEHAVDNLARKYAHKNTRKRRRQSPWTELVTEFVNRSTPDNVRRIISELDECALDCPIGLAKTIGRIRSQIVSDITEDDFVSNDTKNMLHYGGGKACFGAVAKVVQDEVFKIALSQNEHAD